MALNVAGATSDSAEDHNTLIKSFLFATPSEDSPIPASLDNRIRIEGSVRNVRQVTMDGGSAYVIRIDYLGGQASSVKTLIIPDVHTKPAIGDRFVAYFARPAPVLSFDIGGYHIADKRGIPLDVTFFSEGVKRIYSKDILPAPSNPLFETPFH